MIIYKCRFTGDEMCSDAFKPAPVMEDGAEVGGLFKIESQKVNKDSGAAVDIGCGGEFGGGGEDIPDDNAVMVNNVVDESIGFDLHEVPMSKKDLKEFLQAYCKQLRQKLKDDEKVSGPDVKAFTQSAPGFCKFLLSKYDDLQFFTSSSMDPDGSMAFAYYEDVNPQFIYIKMGMIEEKC